MNFAFKVVNIKLITSSPDVAFRIPISAHNTIHVRNHHVVANIEFSSVIEHGPINVKLDNVCFWSTIRMSIFLCQNIVHFVELINDCNTVSAIRQFTRFNYPNISHHFFSFP